MIFLPVPKTSRRNSFSFGSAFADQLFISHSHRRRTLQPCSQRSCAFFLSRSMLSANFLNQNSCRVDGIVVYLQPCLCQKHPCTNMAALRPLKTMSGFPGKSLACSRYLYPFAHSHLRTSISGLVLAPLILDILKARCSGEWTSIINRTLSGLFHDQYQAVPAWHSRRKSEQRCLSGKERTPELMDFQKSDQNLPAYALLFS